jgi:hypothetical protein
VIEDREILNRNALDVGAVADDGLAIVVEVKGGGHDSLVEDVELAVFAGLHLVADHRHLAVEVLLEHGHVGHAVGLQVQRPAEVVVAGVDGLEVHGLVEGCGSVEVAGGAVGEVLEELAAVLGALEGHVLQEMGHAGLAIGFVARADAVDDVDGDLGLGVVGKQEDVQAVGKGVLRDALDGGHLLNALRQGLREGGDSQKDGGCNESEKPFEAHGSPFQVSAANYMRENFMALKRGCDSLMDESDAPGRRSARRWKERCRQRRMYVRRRAGELVRDGSAGGGAGGISHISESRCLPQRATALAGAPEMWGTRR